MLRLERCYYLHFTRHSELLRASLIESKSNSLQLHYPDKVVSPKPLKCKGALAYPDHPRPVTALFLRASGLRVGLLVNVKPLPQHEHQGYQQLAVELVVHPDLSAKVINYQQV